MNKNPHNLFNILLGKKFYNSAMEEKHETDSVMLYNLILSLFQFNHFKSIHQTSCLF